MLIWLEFSSVVQTYALARVVRVTNKGGVERHEETRRGDRDTGRVWWRVEVEGVGVFMTYHPINFLSQLEFTSIYAIL